MMIMAELGAAVVPEEEEEEVMAEMAQTHRVVEMDLLEVADVVVLKIVLHQQQVLADLVVL